MFKLDDTVLARIIQIVQEAMLTGIDSCDVMRAIELEKSQSDEHRLVLTKAYEDMVKKEYDNLLEFAKKQQEQRS